MSRRPLLVGILVWLAVVVVGSVATWTVIDAAGKDVTARPASDPSAAGVPASTTTGDATSATPTRRPERTPRPGRRPSVRPSQQPSTPAVPTTAPVPTQAPTSAAPQPTRAPEPTRSPTSRPASPEPQPVDRTWAGQAGSVTARCAGGRVSLVSATPSDGWRMEVDERGPSRVRVELRRAGDERSDGEDEAERESDSVDVRAECAGGVPRFRVQT